MDKDIEILEIKGFQKPDTSLLLLDKELRIRRKRKKIFLILAILLITIISILLLLYGPYKGFKNWFIEKSFNNNFDQIAKILYDDDSINAVIGKNYIKEPLENSDPSKITFINTQKNNKYEKKLLEHSDYYKVIKIKEKNLTGYLIAIYDSSKIKLENDSSKILKGKVAINAGIIYNDSLQGIVIKDGNLLADNTRANVGGGIIGFNKENKLILGKYTKEETLNFNIKNAIEYGPFLIVNGKNATISGNGGWPRADRSGIAQRKDGIVLFVYLKDAMINDLLTVFKNYNAYNAANLPGDENSVLVQDGNIINSKNTNIPCAFVLE